MHDSVVAECDTPWSGGVLSYAHFLVWGWSRMMSCFFNDPVFVKLHVSGNWNMEDQTMGSERCCSWWLVSIWISGGTMLSSLMIMITIIIMIIMVMTIITIITIIIIIIINKYMSLRVITPTIQLSPKSECRVNGNGYGSKPAERFLWGWRCFLELFWLSTHVHRGYRFKVSCNQSQPASRFSENVQVTMGAMSIIDWINGEIVFNTDHGPSVLLRFGLGNGWWLTVSRYEKQVGKMDGAALGYWTCHQWLRYRHQRAHQQWTNGHQWT